MSDEAWAAAHERLTASRDTYLRTNRGTLWGKPANGVESKYLLTGLAQCGVCGGGVYVATRSHGRQRAFFYACATFHRKGHNVCANHLKVIIADADWAVMEAVQDEILDPVVVEAAVRQALATLTQTPDDLETRLQTTRARVATLENEIARLTEAIAAGGALGALVTALKQREQDRRRLADEAQQLESAIRAGGVDVDTIHGELGRRVRDWRTLAARNVAQGRQILRKLLRGRVRFTPRDDGKIELSGQADYGKLFSGIPLATALASPTRFESLKWP